MLGQDRTICFTTASFYQSGNEILLLYFEDKDMSWQVLLFSVISVHILGHGKFCYTVLFLYIYEVMAGSAIHLYIYEVIA